MSEKFFQGIENKREWKRFAEATKGNASISIADLLEQAKELKYANNLTSKEKGAITRLTGSAPCLSERGQTLKKLMQFTWKERDATFYGPGTHATFRIILTKLGYSTDTPFFRSFDKLCQN